MGDRDDTRSAGTDPTRRPLPLRVAYIRADLGAAKLAAELAVDIVFGPTTRGAAMALGAARRWRWRDDGAARRGDGAERRWRGAAMAMARGGEAPHARRGAATALGKLADRHGPPVGVPAGAPKRGTFLVSCGLLCPGRRRAGRQGEADRLRMPAGGGLRARVLHERRDGPGIHRRL